MLETFPLHLFLLLSFLYKTCALGFGCFSKPSSSISMGLVTLPPTLHYSIARTISNPVSFIVSRANNSHNINPCYNKSSHKPAAHHVAAKFHSSPFLESSFPSSRHIPLSPLSATSSGSGEQDHRALEAVLKFYSAIKNKNPRELSDIIGDECRCFCNFISFLQPLQGKQQVMEFIVYLIKTLGDSIEFVITPTVTNGLCVGVKWRLECSKTGMPLGKGFSFYTCHVYHGKVLIRNVEMIMEPLLHLEPLRLKLMAFVMALTCKICSSIGVFKSKTNRKRLLYILLLSLLLFIALSLIF